MGGRWMGVALHTRDINHACPCQRARFLGVADVPGLPEIAILTNMAEPSKAIPNTACAAMATPLPPDLAPDLAMDLAIDLATGANLPAPRRSKEA